MTDRLDGVFVVFERDIRTDDAEAIINAIKCLRNVLDVKPHVSDFSAEIAAMRVREELGQKLLDVVFDRPRKTDIR